MQFNGHYAITAPPEAVWAALNDPNTLKACIPGCQALEKTGPTTFIGSAKLQIGPMRATFRGRVDMTEPDPPRRCVLRGEGQGGVAGFARGESEVVLTPENDGTALAYTAKATVGGKLAQVGQRLLDSAARQLADEFFANFAAAVTGAQEASATRSRTVPAPGPPGAREPSAAVSVREGIAPEIWIVGLIAIIIILLILFGLVL